jgi:hypothetical protein
LVERDQLCLLLDHSKHTDVRHVAAPHALRLECFGYLEFARIAKAKLPMEAGIHRERYGPSVHLIRQARLPFG